MHKFSLKKSERLSRKKVIDKLFSEGNAFFSYPLKVIFLETELPVEYAVQAGFSVSKRNFKKAVQRNLLKRRMREAYRLNKHVVSSDIEGKQLAVMFIYSAKEIEDSQLIEKGMIKALKNLRGKL